MRFGKAKSLKDVMNYQLKFISRNSDENCRRDMSQETACFYHFVPEAHCNSPANAQGHFLYRALLKHQLVKTTH